MDWFVVCFVHDTQNIFRYNFIFKCIYAFLHVFVQGPRFTSMWQLKICTFIMRCLILLFVAFHSLSMPLPTSVWFFFYLRQLLSMTQYILNCSPLLFLHKLIKINLRWFKTSFYILYVCLLHLTKVSSLVRGWLRVHGMFSYLPLLSLVGNISFRW